MTALAPVSVAARLGNGVALPLVLFLLWQYALIASTSGTGSWAGMMVFFSSLVTVPALAVLNLWVLAVRWRGHFHAFFAGLALPAAFGALEAFVMFGSGRALKPLESALESPFAPFVAIAFTVPLVAAFTMAVARRRRERAASPGPVLSGTGPGPSQT